MIETINFGGKIPTKIFSFRKEMHDFEDTWEREYIQELISTLKKGMVVYDIGAENGETTVLAANIVGGENVHIFEPNKDYFPNIKAIWDANELEIEGNCFCVYIDEKTTNYIGDTITLNDFKDKPIFHGCYHANPSVTPLPTISLDDYSEVYPKPDVVMIDVEGAELSIVRGAQKLIKEHAPIFFISIHRPEFILDRSNGTKEELFNILLNAGYHANYLSTDHEEHWKFRKNH